MIPRVSLALAGNLAAIDPVLQHEIEGATRQFLAAIFGAVLADR